MTVVKGGKAALRMTVAMRELLIIRRNSYELSIKAVAGNCIRTGGGARDRGAVREPDRVGEERSGAVICGSSTFDGGVHKQPGNCGRGEVPRWPGKDNRRDGAVSERLGVGETEAGELVSVAGRLGAKIGLL